MEHQTVIWIKSEEADEIHLEPRPVFLEDPLALETSNDVKEDADLKFGQVVTESNINALVEIPPYDCDPLSIKEEVPIKAEAEEEEEDFTKVDKKIIVPIIFPNIANDVNLKTVKELISPLPQVDGMDTVKWEADDNKDQNKEKIVSTTFPKLEGGVIDEDIVEQHSSSEPQQFVKVLIKEEEEEGEEEEEEEEYYTKMDNKRIVPMIFPDIANCVHLKTAQKLRSRTPQGKKMDVVQLEAVDNKGQNKEKIVSITFPKLEGGVIDTDIEEHCSAEPQQIEEEITARRCAPDSTRLIKITNEIDSSSFEETCLQGVTEDEMEFGAEQSPHSSTSGTSTQVFLSLEDSELCTTNENEIHDFTCSSCKQRFSSKYRLIVHVFIHIDGVQPPVHICTWCGEVFLTHSVLSKHVSKCKLNRHLHVITDNRICNAPENSALREKCSTKTISKDCPSVSDTELILNSLFSVETSERSLGETRNVSRISYTETYGPNSSLVRNSSETLTHIKYYGDSQEESYPCVKVPDEYGYVKCYEKTCPGERAQTCDVSNMSLLAANSLRPHTPDSHGNHIPQSDCLFETRELVHAVRRPHKCGVCRRTFSKSGNLKRHAIVHTGDESHKCAVCGKVFTHSATLKKHEFTHTGEKQKCNVCGKSFARTFHLKTHTLLHSGERPHKCAICGKAFIDSFSLKKHSFVHADVLPHKCDICEKSFADTTRLKKHSLSHSGERPHKCAVCGKSFTYAGSLKVHELIHTGERQHKCRVCGKSFTHAQTLKRHAAIHTRKKPH